MTKEEEERGGRSGPKIDAKESGQHLQAESKTDGETDVRRTWARRADAEGQTDGGEREEGREGREST